MTLPPIPPTSMLVAFQVLFAVRKKTLTFALPGSFAYAPTLKWGGRGPALPMPSWMGERFFGTHRKEVDGKPSAADEKPVAALAFARAYAKNMHAFNR